MRRITNQFRKSLRKRLPGNLALVNKQMVACNFIEKGPYKRCFAWNKLKFLQKLFLSTSPGNVSRTPANI